MAANKLRALKPLLVKPASFHTATIARNPKNDKPVAQVSHCLSCTEAADPVHSKQENNLKSDISTTLPLL